MHVINTFYHIFNQLGPILEKFKCICSFL